MGAMRPIEFLCIHQTWDMRRRVGTNARTHPCCQDILLYKFVTLFLGPVVRGGETHISSLSSFLDKSVFGQNKAAHDVLCPTAAAMSLAGGLVSASLSCCCCCALAAMSLAGEPVYIVLIVVGVSCLYNAECRNARYIRYKVTRGAI